MADIIATERIYDPKQLEQGVSVVLYHEGDTIPAEIAAKLGIAKPAATKKVSPAENKAVKPAAATPAE